jgi:hypothetical protein
MSTPNRRTPDEITQLRQMARELELRLQADPAYLQQLRDDPLGALRAAGFDDRTAPEVAAEITRGTHRLPGGWEHTARPSDEACDGSTCIITCMSTWTGRIH